MYEIIKKDLILQLFYPEFKGFRMIVQVFTILLISYPLRFF